MAGGARFLPIGFGFLFLSSCDCILPATGAGVELSSERSSNASGCVTDGVVSSDFLLPDSDALELSVGNRVSVSGNRLRTTILVFLPAFDVGGMASM